MTVASQILETLLKDTATALILDGNRETDMVTEVTCISTCAESGIHFGHATAWLQVCA